MTGTDYLVGHASPALRTRLARVERDLALRSSPGSLAAVLTDEREIQAVRLELIDDAFRTAVGETVRLMLTMPPRHGKSRRAARWARGAGAAPAGQAVGAQFDLARW